MADGSLKHYFNELNIEDKPEFLNKYLKAKTIKRLKKISYFCGMDNASKAVYDFAEYITRYDHSLTTAIMIYRLTQDKKLTVAGLCHDISTPCFSHVIDYMNKDYSNQESTEEYTKDIIMSDKYLLDCLKEDNIDVNDIIDFKQFTVVDNDRPKLCADRLDGLILTAIGWTKEITNKEISKIVKDISIYTNEYGEDEIGFSDKETAKRVMELAKNIDIVCHHNSDNYMMELLARITKHAIDSGYIQYENLYYLDEEAIFEILENKKKDKELQDMLYKFKYIKEDEIELTEIPNIKPRKLNVLLNGIRL